MTRKQLHDLTARLLRCRTRRGVARVLRQTIRQYGLDRTKLGTWGWYFERFARHFTRGALPHSIFNLEGNTKLAFATFSTLPQYTCPGAGACLEWCYSFRAWRYPGGYLRQLQNTWLLRYEREAIRQAWYAIPQGLTVRLYVDGDIDSTDTWRFWVVLMGQREDLRVYGYSKSWDILAGWQGRWPANYTLNVSEGSRHDTDDELRERVNRLPITRGAFGAVQVGDGPDGAWRGHKRYGLPEYHRAVREQAREQHGKVFSCPGDCRTCCGGNHACGNRDFPVTIMIGTH